jgi:transposase
VRGNGCRTDSFARMWNTIIDEDPSAQILSAWIAKEELRTVLSTVRLGGRAPDQPPTAPIPDLVHRLPGPRTAHPGRHHRYLVAEINAYIHTGITNARRGGLRICSLGGGR